MRRNALRLRLLVGTAVLLCLAAFLALIALPAGAAPDTAVTFAVIGDYGDDNAAEADVAALVHSWNPDFIITTGDNNYDVGAAATIDLNIGQYYHDFIYPYTGSYGGGATTNRFFPSLGNHDWGSLSCNPACAGPYFDYFQLPGNERYYDFVWGDVHLFAVDSDYREPDGIGVSSAQAAWLQGALAASTARWKVVYFHHPPYTSGTRADLTALRWPFASWGATAVLNGHDHFYERLQIDGIPYIINGAGGRSLYGFGQTDPHSLVRYNGDHGAGLVTADAASITFDFYNRAGTLIDSYTVSGSPTGVRHFVPFVSGGGGTAVWPIPLVALLGVASLAVALGWAGQSDPVFSPDRLRDDERRLLRLLRGQPETVDDALLAAAVDNELASTVAHRLADRDGWTAVPAPWRAAHQQTEARLRAYLAELDAVAARLDEAGIPLVALKNSGIARALHCPGCCPMGDVDVLVERRHFRRAHQILLDAGFHFDFRSDLETADLDAAEQGGGAEYWKTLPGGEKLWFELQWRPVAGRWIRPDQEPPAEALVARSQPIPGTAVRLLAPEDNLLQVALHTAKHSYVRAPGFRLHFDVDRIVRAGPVDWERFVAQVQALQVQTAVYFALRIPHDLFDTPVPERVLAAIRPSAWKERLLAGWIRRAGLFDPDAPKFSRPGYILFTALLYDDLPGLWRGIFPDAAWMRRRYAVRHPVLLPLYHARRLADLVFKRQL